MPANISVYTTYDCVKERTSFHELVLRLLQGTVVSEGQEGQTVCFTLYKREDPARYPQRYSYWLKCQGMRAAWAKSSLRILTDMFGIRFQIFDYEDEEELHGLTWGCTLYFDRNVLEVERIQVNNLVIR